LNIAPVFFVVVGVVILAGAGMLTTDMKLNPQEFVAFPSVTNFDSFECACSNPDPNGSPEFGMMFCDFDEFLPNGDPNPGFIGANALMLCTWETSQLLYGSALPANYWDGEGCNVDFWKTNDDPGLPAEYAWPASYVPTETPSEVTLPRNGAVVSSSITSSPDTRILARLSVVANSSLYLESGT